MATNTLTIRKNQSGEIDRIFASLGGVLKEKNGKFIGKIQSLRIVAPPGKTRDEANDNLRLAVKIFFEVHGERKSLEHALRNFGWRTEASFLDVEAELTPPIELLTTDHDVEIEETLSLAG